MEYSVGIKLDSIMNNQEVMNDKLDLIMEKLGVKEKKDGNT